MTHVLNREGAANFPVPHLAFPVRFITLPSGAKAAEQVEQDSYEEIRGCVEVILLFEKGSRPEQPDFGIVSPLFENAEIDPKPIVDSIAAWEPRAEVTINPKIDPTDVLTQNVTVTIADTTSGGIDA